MQKSEWLDKTVSFEYLRKAASADDGNISMVSWLRLIGVIPSGVEWRRGNRHPNTNLNPSAIPAGYLAELAHDWDAEGITTPAYFVDALSFEVGGQPNKRSVEAVYSELAAENQAWSDS